MITISLCMIVKDEEKTIGKCLSGVKSFVDEIIIVDTGSKDETKEIAKSFGSKIYDYKWIDDFSEARNYAFSKATKSYILWLDGDDYIDEINIEKFKKLKDDLRNNTDAVSMVYSLLRNENGETVYQSRRNRLVKRNKNYRWIGHVHEYLEVSGNILASDIVINHNKQKESSDRNLNIFRKMEESGEAFTDRDLFYYANELYDNGFSKEAYDKYIEFIETGRAWEGDFKRATLRAVYCIEDIDENIEKKKELIFYGMKKFPPNGEMLCTLGNLYLRENKYREAKFWYKAALEMEVEKGSLEITNTIYNNWIPAINLCVCYSSLGDYKRAYYYNELCNLRGGSKEKVEYNRKFLNKKLAENGIEIGDIKTMLIME